MAEIEVPLKVEITGDARKAIALDELQRVLHGEHLAPAHEFEDVRRFHDKFGLMIGARPRFLTQAKLRERAEFMLEELTEFVDAAGLSLMGDGMRNVVIEVESSKPQDLPSQADALVDLVYVALGTAVMLGLPWAELWADVQRANLAKVPGVTKRGHAHDVTKPTGWDPPHTHRVLMEAGWLRPDGAEQLELWDDDGCHRTGGAW